jgi:VWFA-related protein
VTFFLLLLLAATPFAAQEPAVFRADTALALVHFHAVHKTQYLTNLKPEDVILLEDGVPRPFTLFDNAANGRTLPVEVTLLFDTSGSVTDAGLLDPLAFEERLLTAFDNVTLSVFGFTTRLDRYCRPSRDLGTLRAALAGLQSRTAKVETIKIPLAPKRKANAGGGTWIYAAIAQAAREAAATPGNASRLILVFSDGFDTTSGRPEDAAGVARDLGVAIYPVALGHWALVERVRAEQQRLASRNSRDVEVSSPTLDRLQLQEREIVDFASLGELTGGRSYDPREISLTVMKQVLDGLVWSIRTEYTIGFSPERSDSLRKHRLEVRLRDKEIGRVTGGARTIVH